MTLVTSLLVAQSLAGVESFHRGEYELAVSQLEAASSSPVRDAFLGLSLAATGRCPQAAPLLEKKYEVRDLARLTRMAGVQCHLAAGRNDRAVELSAALERDFPGDPDVLLQAARVHMRAFNAKVARLFDAAPASHQVNQLSAEIFEREGKFAEAVAEYRKAIGKNPNAVNLHYRLGRALLMQGTNPENLSEARAAFAAELKFNPRDAVAEFQIGQIDLVEGRADEAASRFVRALRLQPDFVEAMLALAKVRGREGVDLLERAVRLQPQNESARYALMIAYRNAGRAEDAARQKAELDKLQQRPEGEFSEFLKRLGEKTPKP
jgi:tetratricopeptide (TPR) repeat protein